MLVGKLVRDLDIPCAIVGCPTVREADGLALSSRNLRLSPGGPRRRPGARRRAPRRRGGDRRRRVGGRHPAAARARILAAGFGDVEYLELRREADLAPAAGGERPARLLAAAWIGGVRLIDNVPLPAS